ncbi:hypothetical protein [Brachyspira hampsonii]|uniref:Cell surface protein n=1 Tax=Brachyspira hampsonii TaxID=1287055 RepID=A0AAC9TT60_9SPIR|nr:hypothetical protein [Brachyspira hampsonii]ASJ21700.1 hypothetical protein BHAMNSH16_08635 [Brachyspira hampsonii]ELV06685.1 hypothetical protein H263_02654 [Brachyspira hampsonii 30599]OEJ18845.1 hypothetical protein A9496_06445 [Brachyspira hampsonii]
MKKIILFLLSINFLWAFPPSEAYFSELLSDNGKVTKNTMQAYDVNDYGMVYFDGEITLTGVLERSDNDDMGDNYTALRFYPDNNVDLPFLYASFEMDLKNQCASKYGDSWDFSGVEFDRLDFGVLLENIEVKLPEPLNKRFLGIAAVRAEVTIRNYRFYEEGDAGREAYGDIVGFKALGDVETKYFSKNNYNSGNVSYNELQYNSKDNYVNIRYKANGKIIGKILKRDMIYNGGVLLSINGAGIDYENYKDIETKWLEVFYLPPEAEDGKDAIHGFVHGSQVKLENGGY